MVVPISLSKANCVTTPLKRGKGVGIEMKFCHVLEGRDPKILGPALVTTTAGRGPAQQRGWGQMEMCSLPLMWDEGCVSSTSEGCLERDPRGSQYRGGPLKPR